MLIYVDLFLSAHKQKIAVFNYIVNISVITDEAHGYLTSTNVESKEDK